MIPLLPVLATDIAQLSVTQAKASLGYNVRHFGSADSQPYLPLVGAPGLRFLEVIPPPIAAVPPPSGGGSERKGAEVNADVVKKPALGTNLATPVNSAVVAPKRDVILPEKPSASAIEENRPAAILPDDAEPKVKPEDFLPFFEFPGSGKETGRDASGVPAAPAPGALPPSSATYKEQ